MAKRIVPKKAKPTPKPKPKGKPVVAAGAGPRPPVQPMPRVSDADAPNDYTAPPERIEWRDMNAGQRLGTLLGGGPNRRNASRAPTRPPTADFWRVAEAGRQTITREGLREARDTQAAQRGTQQRAENLSDQAQEFTEQERDRRDRTQQQIGQTTLRADRQLETQLASAGRLPAETAASLQRITDDFNQQVAGATGEVKDWATSALADTLAGQGAAMTAATQGMQSQINSQVAAIQSNPDIPASQKQQMINQTRMQGAMAIMPAVGQTILGFQKLRADINTQTIGTLGSIMSAATSARGGLAATSANVMGAAHSAAKELGVKITEDRIASRQWAVAARQTNDAARMAAEQFNQTAQLALLPARQDPVLYTTPVFLTDLALQMDALTRTTQAEIANFGLDVVQQMAAVSGASEARNMILGGFFQGGPRGAAMGVGLNILGGNQ